MCMRMVFETIDMAIFRNNSGHKTNHDVSQTLI